MVPGKSILTSIGTNYCHQILGMLKIYNGYRSFIGTGTGNFSFFLVVSEKFGTGKSLGTGIGKIWYRKKSQNRYWKNFVPRKVLVSVTEIFGTGKSNGIV